MALGSGGTLRQGIREELTPKAVRSTSKASTNADTNIFADDYIVPYDCTLRLLVALDTAAVLSYVLKRDKTTIRIDLKSGTTLTAGAAHMFDISLMTNDKVNFRVDTSCTVLQLDLFKIRLAAP